MIGLIPSKDMRSFLAEQGHEFSDFEKVTLIYNSRGHKKSEIEQALRELALSTQDEKLIKQINEMFEDYEHRFEAFINRNDEFIYHLSGIRDVRCQTDTWDIELGYFASHEIAKKWGLEYSEPFSVKKVRLLSEDDNPRSLCSGNYFVWDAGLACGEICYDSDGNISSFWDNELDENPVKIFTAEDRARFEHAYIDIPYSFRTGDIVRVVDSEDSVEFGVVTCERTETEYQAWREKLNKLNIDGALDFIDCAVTVNFIDNNGKFSHDHINPLRLEYAEISEGNPYKEALEYARDVLVGKGNIESFQRACEKMGVKYNDNRCFFRRR